MADILLDNWKSQTREFLIQRGYDDRMKGTYDMWYNRNPFYLQGMGKAEENKDCPPLEILKTMGERIIPIPVYNGKFNREKWEAWHNGT